MPTHIATPTRIYLPSLIDNYSEINSDGSFIQVYGAYIPAVGQSFTNGQAGVLDKCKFYLTKSGVITGNAYAKVYSHTGTFGSSGIPDTLLATSDAFDVSTLGYSASLKTFTFSGAEKITLTANTKYFIVFEYTGGSATKHVWFNVDSITPTHSGNLAYYTGGAWTGSAAFDGIFYIYRDASPFHPISPTHISQPTHTP